ncbi:MAG: hypothetical protein COV29_02095 [Candidatus Yanofskybacteria bacterium CG10_big_fil_rev_8_21_14_0_10_36_16]|uniref:6-hydroxymethylpterin diphosphokinase MptE-like domain-containing protein n=1 Tax=Candidatus Yanofskybacteria bacterium CG10_big_fil_rev_8_21_14_0_10_36_16 TaxID=1975096 RepID=A0A2J0Q7J2_9BACT|nr:MAG: hypothetical protein COV29_02095 [Candidatus Yanofskybacteria bacterium CG10_big_fil_rev_8_21_14_0_10_36_16]
MSLGKKLSLKIGEATALKTESIGLKNAKRNAPYFSNTVEDLAVSNKEAAIVIVGGPSLHRKNPVEKILNSNFKGDIVTADGSLGYCLRNGLVPDYVLCLDPHPYRIVRWFGDPDLESRPEDDYYSRQDLDPEHWKDEKKWNKELIKLVNHHGPRIKAILSTSVDTTITKRCIEAGMEIFWWNPLYDDIDEPNSVAKKLNDETGIPCMVTGGNVGTASWIFAHAILNRKHVALAGIDLSYAPGTPHRNTQYYYELIELFGDRAPEAFIDIYNPYLNETWFTDPTYYWFKNVFLELAPEANCTTYNCTEGGILFEDPIKFIPMSEFLYKFTERGE